MAYNLKRVRTYTWPAYVGVPIDGGKYDEVEITVRFRAMPQSELEAICSKIDAALKKLREADKAGQTKPEAAADEVGDLDNGRKPDVQPAADELSVLEKYGIKKTDRANIVLLKVVTEGIDGGIDFESDDGDIVRDPAAIKAQAFDYLFIITAIDTAWLEAQSGYERKN